MTTGITWTEETWNPIVGCSIVSKGCTNCYAMQWAGQRMDGNPKSPHYADTTKQVNDHHVWTGKLAQAPEATLLKPLRWQRPRMIFVNSMSDLFHEAVPDEWIDQVFAVMALTPQHTYQILTKRPQRMKAYMSKTWHFRVMDFMRIYGKVPKDKGVGLNTSNGGTLANVWLGVSVEDQATADERIPLLLDTPAALRWISAEPLLGPIDLVYLNRAPSVIDKAMPGFSNVEGFYLDALNGGKHIKMKAGIGYSASSVPPKLDWVVIGGESGRDARPMHPDWARSLRDQCADAAVPFFFKQWGEWHPMGQTMADGTTNALDKGQRPGLWHEGSMSARVGKGAAGDLLDGVRHHNWPLVSQ
ncbi:MAG: phage Gp37/Gp68 family protein [Asticcacaulis sp.]|nr:phage Gp37/Gp68 family protein [Asticcacaulis sp.]